MRSITIDNKTYIIEDDEFEPYTHKEYNNLKLYKDLAEIERVVDLLRDIRYTFYSNICRIQLGLLTVEEFGGYIDSKLNTGFDDEYKNEIFCSLDPLEDIEDEYDFVLCHFPLQKLNYTSFTWVVGNYELYLNVHSKMIGQFRDLYQWYLSDTKLNYENLIHLVMIVKNAGDDFADILNKNIPHIDRWTILDTGSTDNTVNIINQVLTPKVRGELYQEPFVDFGTSRNRALELAGDSCKFTLMLDDTYYIDGDLRGFLNEVRSDQFSDSFSLYITSNDVQYVSNRVLKTNRKLKYWFKIHEVVQSTDNINVIVPLNRASIIDKQSDYMQSRTNNRKTLDLELLFASIKEEPENPRHYYYVAQTYVCLQNWEMAYKYFLQRVYHPNEGFLQEKIDACFEAARTGQFQLKKPWSEIEPLYKKAYEMDPTRPDSVYFLAIKDYLEGNEYPAYKNFKKAFEIGYPEHAQYSLKPTLSYHYTPKFLTELCYKFDDFTTGEQASKLYISKNAYDSSIDAWNRIYNKLNKLPTQKQYKNTTKPFLCFVADGNWNPWTGRDINTKGLGGSETYIVEMARWIQKSGHFQVVVFCRCSVEETFENVMYKDLEKYYAFIQTYLVHTSIISRFSEYIPVTYKSNVENVYLVVHDISPSCNVIPIEKKLKNIFLLTEWHKEYTDQIFPTLNHLTKYIHYGINSNFVHPEPTQYPKNYHKYIYSSFANRGLKILLELWPDIRRITQNQATLQIFSNIDHEWTKQNYSDDMQYIKTLLDKYNRLPDKHGIKYHSWVDKNTLARAWLDADVWFYPCTFVETFCMTALEAAASRTLVITNDLGALRNTAKHGLIIPGDANSSEWKQKAIQLIANLSVSDVNHSIDINYEWALEHSWEAQSNKLLEYILPHNIEFRNMYNWTFDLPKGSRKIFERHVLNTMQWVDQPKILEIGTWTGTSVIELLKLLPNSTATTIDPWENYDEFNSKDMHIMASYFRNIQNTGLINRITTYKSTSREQLLKLYLDQEYYHLIYVDGSHHSLDVYLDLVLSWKLLAQDGLLIIDDYMFIHQKEEDPIKNILNVPYTGVNHFLGQYASELTILHKDYRIFIQKRVL